MDFSLPYYVVWGEGAGDWGGGVLNISLRCG